MIGGMWAKRITLALGVPGEADGLGGICLGRWEGWQLAALNLLSKFLGLDGAGLVGAKQSGVEMSIFNAIPSRIAPAATPPRRTSPSSLSPGGGSDGWGGCEATDNTAC